MEKRKLTPLGVIIRKRLLDKGMTQLQLAQEVGTTKVYLNYILHGERPGKKYLPRILAVLDIDPEIVRQHIA
ncbi:MULTISPECIES: helix-turn-helix domain-containing protein [Paenibacillus]|uniref:helix-turn-helix domain-containing protein n=1 Tax=Paenibacillus TaxID=44249 RepID=UPI000567B362|nr:helix-turn-helix transcriptional regulator [Paenibacillus macerans]MCY7558251.1 helix-turn-helix domain-containing protein [Paenibacillus macerans]MEC0154611.1 helix-turn-helix transcriptional regulator [Paenibacillus macerans]SUA85656.1 Helix-turn-helix [Paenibacillus macerans]